MPAVNAATCQVLSTESPVDQGHHIASYDTSLIVSGGVDCGRRRRSVYDKKPQRYIKDNRTAHLTARSDKSVAYVTNNKRLYRRFVRVDYTIVWSGIYHERLWYNLLISWPSSYGQNGPANNAINWSINASVEWVMNLWDVISLQTLCWEIGGENRSWNNVEANYWQTGRIARTLATAELGLYLSHW